MTGARMSKAHEEWLRWLGTLNPEKKIPKEMRTMYAGLLCMALRGPSGTSGQIVQTGGAPQCKNGIYRQMHP